MGQPIAVRTDFATSEVRRLAQRRRTAIRSGAFWRSLPCSMAHRDHRPFVHDPRQNTLIDQPWKIMSIALRLHRSINLRIGISS